MQPFRQESIAVGNDCAVLQVTGEVDVYLRDVDFLDSTGLGALVGSLKQLRTHDGSFKVVASGGRALRIFQITGLTHAFALHPSVLDAMTTDEHWQAAVAGEGHDSEEWCRKHGLL